MQDKIEIVAVRDDIDNNKVKIYSKEWLLTILLIEEYKSLFGEDAMDAMFFSDDYASSKVKLTLEVSACPL